MTWKQQKCCSYGEHYETLGLDRNKKKAVLRESETTRQFVNRICKSQARFGVM